MRPLMNIFSQIEIQMNDDGKEELLIDGGPNKKNVCAEFKSRNSSKFRP